MCVFCQTLNMSTLIIQSGNWKMTTSWVQRPTGPNLTWVQARTSLTTWPLFSHALTEKPWECSVFPRTMSFRSGPLSHQLIKMCAFSRIWNKHSWANSLVRRCLRFHSWVCTYEKNKNTNLKTYTQPNVQSSAIYNSQGMKTTKMSINRKMDKEDVVWTSLVIQWWRDDASTAWDMCLILSQVIENLTWPKNRNKKKIQCVCIYIHILWIFHYIDIIYDNL